MTDPLSFELNIDIGIIDRIYPGRLPIEFKTWWDISKSYKEKVNITSPLVIHHPRMREFNDLYAHSSTISDETAKEENYYLKIVIYNKNIMQSSCK